MKTLNRGFAKRLLSVLLSLMMILSLCTVGIVSASAAEADLAETASFDGGIKLYLKPNSNWKTDSAWFAIYVFNDSTGTNSWAKMSVDATQSDIYVADVPSGTWEGVIFCRMNKDTSTTGWDNVWNQTSDLKDGVGTYNLYTVADGAWSKGDGSWSTYVNAGTGEETGSNTATVYVDIANTSSFSTAPYLYVWEASTDTAIGTNWPGVLMSGPNADGYYYRTFNFDSSYKFIVHDNGNTNKTSDSDEFTATELLVSFTSGLSYTTEILSDSTNTFWVDVDGDTSTTTDIIYPSSNTLYLPSGVTRTSVTLVAAEDSTVTVNDTDVTTDGVQVDLSGSTCTVNDATYKVMQSANVSSVHTFTEEAVPQSKYYPERFSNEDDYNKDQYETTNGSIVVYDKDGNKLNTKSDVLKKIKGRGNSSWKASCVLIGKYAFNITLDKTAKLLDESEASKKYCLVSYNADQARMRNMVIYELAQQIGVQYVADYEPVDFYNNGKYIGSYLLTDKVEIGDPLVDLDVDLDGINEELSDTNTALYKDDSTMTRASSNGNINDTSTKGFYKYISNLEEPDASVYADSGFLLEFELNERFAAEISGFISTKGQQIVCKYPEYATYNEITFIMDKWNTAEALMYDTSASYEELSAVIDVESFAKMYLIQELSKNLDGGATSYYVYYDGGKLHAGVAWDYDWTLGQYRNSQSGKINSSSVFYSDVNADPSNTDGWYLNSKNIYGGSTFNAQAALCQNENFWAVVAAEWNELFYSEALNIADSTVTSVSELDGNMREFYNLVSASTAMDEDKWGLIASNPLYDWGSSDTGDNHDEAVVSLNNWYYNRLVWMNGKLSVENYTIQPPVLSVDKDSYAAGETVTLTIDDVTDGDYTYYISNGEGTITTTANTYTFTANTKGTTEYTVYAVSNTSHKPSANSKAVAVNVEGFTLTLDVEAPTSVGYNDKHSIKATTNADDEYDVTYRLYWVSDDGDIEKTDKASQTVNGLFENIYWDQNAIGYTATWKVVASVTVDGETYTAEKTVEILVTGYDFIVTLNAPETVEAGYEIILSASAPLDTESTVTYNFYNADTDTLIASNSNGVYRIAVTEDDIGSDLSYYVIASATITDYYGNTETFSKQSETKTVSVTEVKEAYDVIIYFKSTSTLGYKPLLTTDGAVTDYADYAMTKDTFICYNATQTASYYWYRADVQVSKASPTVSVSILSSRYAMEGDIDLTITQSGAIYLAVDNLNEGYEMINLTDWDEDARNWTQSALHMVYDEAYDTEASYAEVSARVNLTSVGDANGDGVVNIKDATLVQKFLAGLEQMDSLSVEISDVNDDGILTIKDATAIQKKIAGCL